MFRGLFSRSGTTGATTIVQLPLAFVRSGNININDQSINNIGNNGYFWARTAASATSAYSLGIGIISAGSSNNYGGRWFGFPLRCRFLFLH